jgi:general secretion pathway protein M
METALPDGARGRLLVLGLTAALIASVWFACAAPLIGWYGDRAEHLAQRQAVLARMEALAGSWGDLERLAAGGHPQAATLLDGSSDALAAAALQETVQAMATASGAQFASTETLPAEARGAYRRIALRVTLAAPWPVLIDLLRRVVTGRRTMLVDDLLFRVAPGQEYGAAAPVSASMIIVAFRASAEQSR